jgi:glycosyltransferase involved in cell wall biosynthesis
MKVCYFGTYSVSDGYPRNRVIIAGLRAAGVIVKECHISLWHDSADKVSRLSKTSGIFLNLIRIIRAQIGLLMEFFRVGDYDILIVGSVGHFEMFIAKCLNLFKRKPIVFEAFISLYDTMVNDRGIVAKGSIKASLLRWLDRTACRLADAVLLDTEAHINYFCREFRFDRKKFKRVFVGADDGIFFPRETPPNKSFTVLFFGTFIPLHGIEYIVKAAKMLESEKDIKFSVIGTGQEEPATTELAKSLGIANIEFIRSFLNEKSLAEHIAGADVCLGIFGKTDKTQNVIPCKVWNCLAMRKAVITADTPAIAELLKDGKDVVLCPAGDAKAIAAKVILLKNNRALLESIAANGNKAFIQSASINAIGYSLKTYLEGIGTTV